MIELTQPASSGERGRFLRQAIHALGFDLAEILEILSQSNAPATTGADVRLRAIQHRDAIRTKIRHLERLASTLDAIVAVCPGKAKAGCFVLDERSHESEK